MNRGNEFDCVSNEIKCYRIKLCSILLVKLGYIEEVDNYVLRQNGPFWGSKGTKLMAETVINGRNCHVC